MVRKISGGRYELVVGAKTTGLPALEDQRNPAIVKEYTDEQMMEIALIENIQRQDLNPLEEAYAYKRLLEEFNLTQEEVAKRSPRAGLCGQYGQDFESAPRGAGSFGRW